MKNMHVKCDLCEWREPIDEVRDFKNWHHVPCPKCGALEIISDHDMQTIAASVVLQAQMMADFLLSDDPASYRTIKVQVDTKGGKLAVTEVTP
jgi:hypothetical protein